MSRDWLTDLYIKVKNAREKELARVLSILRPKAETDSEISEALSILEMWSRKESDLGRQAEYDEKRKEIRV